MSLAVEPLKVVAINEPRLNIDDERYYGILEGGSEVSWKPFTTNSFSNSSFQFKK